jgi:hypothetical protein
VDAIAAFADERVEFFDSWLSTVIKFAHRSRQKAAGAKVAYRSNPRHKTRCHEASALRLPRNRQDFHDLHRVAGENREMRVFLEQLCRRVVGVGLYDHVA